MVDLPHNAPPAPEISSSARVRAMLDMWLKDHGFIRDIYCNRHRISEQAWRSAQPAPHHLRDAKRAGIKTVLNLRGRRDTCGSYILEREACEKLGLRLVDFPIRSRGALEKETLKAAIGVFDTLDYPILMHCKSGADRAGFMAALYLFLREKRPLDEALGQLSLKYGHVRQAKTGVIDYFFRRFREETDGSPDSLRPWIEGPYDPRELDAAFKESWAARVLVNAILHRE